ncbi:zinc finger CCCH domain-containing protein 39-like isoform X1 [Oryza brachyantha]|uniref:zinc finger CCCH domain-containing protein 39-like isoform X1 n=1 Tax=Oryza brachyantha TaxID=4533 RepID=UPI000776A2D1|nr:zinc finger CCCH domain-containing protein 39-like isoform X1 [Oryza brachyantha]
MQEALLPPAHPDRFYSALGPMAFGGVDQRFSSPNPLTSGEDLFYGCYSPFSPSPPPRAASLSHCSSSSDSVIDDVDDAAATEHRLHLTRLALQYQEVANRFELCLSHLADAADEAAALRRENAELRVANNNLACRIAKFGGMQGSAITLAGDLRRLRLAEEQTVPVLPPPPPPPSPPAAALMHPVAVPEKQAVLPKSISIRSTGYQKLNQGGKHRVSKPLNVSSVKPNPPKSSIVSGSHSCSALTPVLNPKSSILTSMMFTMRQCKQQRVFVGIDGAEGGEHKGGVKEDPPMGGLEFEVYNQGMFKTELCNKWEETGACPYGDQCQFAHGVAELRPVIRHPRYKTEVCRMVLSGGVCPYGHRCHFRHSITPADRFSFRR